MNSTIKLTKHAELRMAQRNISYADLVFVLEHGERINTTGVTIYALRKRDIPHDEMNDSRISRLEGTIVLTDYSQNGNLEIITAFRNKNISRAFHGKKKYNWRREQQRTDRNQPTRD